MIDFGFLGSKTKKQKTRNKEADRIKKDSIYQAFYPLKTLPNHKNNSFTVEGLLKSMTRNVMIEEKKAQITFDYKVTNKKLVIKKFEVRK